MCIRDRASAARRVLRRGAMDAGRGVTRLIHIQLGPPAGPRTSTSTGPGGPHIHIHARGLHIHHIQRQNGRIALEISKFSSDSRLAQSAALAAPSGPKGSEFAKFSPAALTAANRPQKPEIPGTKSVFWRGAAHECPIILYQENDSEGYESQKFSAARADAYAYRSRRSAPRNTRSRRCAPRALSPKSHSRFFDFGVAFHAVA